MGTGSIGSTWAVTKAVEQNFDELVATIYKRWGEDTVYEELRAQLWEYYHSPLALNQTAREELKLLCILTDDQLNQLFGHIAKNGPLISIYELQTIPGFDLDTILLLLPFVRVEAVDVARSSPSIRHNELISRNSYSLVRYESILEPKAGYQYNSRQHKVPYVGTPDKLVARLFIRHPNGWELGLTTRKGAGEALTWDPATHRYGFAPWRFHWLHKDRTGTKKILVGDYAVGYGQGVVLNAGFSMDKSGETIKVIRTNNLGAKPHTAVTTTAFKGIATTWQWHPVEFTMYYSNVNLDGKVEKSSSLGGRYVRSVSRQGYYRTENEIAKKGQVNEQVIGSTLVYKGPDRGSELGINLLYSHYSVPIYPNTKNSNPLRFRGKHHANGSLFYRYLWQNFHFFGEGALSKGGGKAAIAGVVASLSHHIDATVLWRHYSQNFHGLYGKSFRENSSSNSNEQGIYLGASASPFRHLYLNAYYDYFHFPWCFGKPRAGHSWLVKTTYQFTKTSLVYFQYKNTTKPRRIAKIKKVATGSNQHYKLRWQCTWSKTISLKSEAQCSRCRQRGVSTWGYAAAQDVTYKIRKLRLTGRVAWFNAKNANNKLYFYEPNMLHAGFNFLAYHGRGMRYCLLACYQPSTALRLELKYALTHHKRINKIGSGYEAIKGNTKNEVRVQAIFRF